MFFLVLVLRKNLKKQLVITIVKSVREIFIFFLFLIFVFGAYKNVCFIRKTIKKWFLSGVL